MFPHVKLSLATLVVIALLAAGIHAAVSVNRPDEIVLTVGTSINLITAKEIITRDAKPDDPIEFTVAEDLVINGHVVVRKGTPAVASVIIPEKGGYLGKSGKLAIHIEATTTSDGNGCGCAQLTVPLVVTTRRPAQCRQSSIPTLFSNMAETLRFHRERL
jgi:hypothetical protein